MRGRTLGWSGAWHDVAPPAFRCRRAQGPARLRALQEPARSTPTPARLHDAQANPPAASWSWTWPSTRRSRGWGATLTAACAALLSCRAPTAAPRPTRSCTTAASPSEGRARGERRPERMPAHFSGAGCPTARGHRCLFLPCMTGRGFPFFLVPFLEWFKVKWRGHEFLSQAGSQDRCGVAGVWIRARGPYWEARHGLGA